MHKPHIAPQSLLPRDATEYLTAAVCVAFIVAAVICAVLLGP